MGQKWSARLLITRFNLQALITGSTLNYPGFYIISNAVASTLKVQVWASSINTLSGKAIDLVNGIIGTYDIVADTFTSSDKADTVTTTNATATTISTIAVPNNKSLSIESIIRGVRTGGSSGNPQDCVYIVLQSLFKTSSGTTSLVQKFFSTNLASNGNCEADAVASGNNALIKVIGDTNNNYSWDCFNTIKSK